MAERDYDDNSASAVARKAAGEIQQRYRPSEAIGGVVDRPRIQHDHGPDLPSSKWGGRSGPMPINRDGADNNVRSGAASGDLAPANNGNVKFGLEGNWKAGK